MECLVAGLFVIGLLIWLWRDGRKHPFCPLCGDSGRRNRKGRAICRFHGDVTNIPVLKKFEGTEEI